MTAQHLRDLEPARRYATLVAVILDTRATLIASRARPMREYRPGRPPKFPHPWPPQTPPPELIGRGL